MTVPTMILMVAMAVGDVPQTVPGERRTDLCLFQQTATPK
jgi:hypothetical protein